MSVTAPPRTWRAAVIGLGVGMRHAAAYVADPRCVLTTVCDLDATRLDAARSEWPGVRTVRNAADVLDDPEIDVVSIATHDDGHADQIVRAIASGQHVFAEKPLCLTPADADRIRRALAARPDVRLTSNLVLRRSPRFRAIRALAAGGTFGRLYHVEADYQYGRLSKLHDGWRGRARDYSVMLGGGVHMIDLLLWLTRRRVVAVRAVGTRISTTEAGAAFPGPDCTTALLEFDDGSTGRVGANFGCVGPHFHGLSLFGTEGSLVNRPEGAIRYAERDAAASPIPVVDEAADPAGKGALIGAFVDRLMGGRSDAVTEDEVFAAMSVGFAIDASVRTGARERVAWPEPLQERMT